MKVWASKLAEWWLRRRGLAVIYRVSGNGVGDALCMTTIMPQLARQLDVRFIVISKFPRLFEGHPLVARNIDFRSLNLVAKPLVKAFLRHVRNDRVICFAYRPHESVPEERYQQDHRRPLPLAQMYAEHIPAQCGVTLDFSALRCEVHLSPEERRAVRPRYGLPERFALIKPTGNLSWSSAKEWGTERFQAVVKAMPEVRWVQAGNADEALLEGTIDLRGRADLRELAALIAEADFVLAMEGLNNHLASAFDTPSFVVFSGVSRIELALYPNTIPIVREPQVACAPCWLRECPVPGKPCTSDITAEQVAGAIRRRLCAARQSVPEITAAPR
jgi:hypothetical protein